MSAAPQHACLLMHSQLPQAAAAALLHEPPPSGRLQEVLLGCLANLAACGCAAALADDATVVLAVVGAGLCGSADPAALSEACRCLRAAVVAPDVPGAVWRCALYETDGALARLLTLLAGTLHAPAVGRAADLVTSLWLAGSLHDRAALLDSGALPAALAALAALPRLAGGDAHAAADAAARCVEAIASDADASAPALALSLADGSLQAALLPPLGQAEAAPTLAASACIALAAALAALQEAASSSDDSTEAATEAVEALVRALAADGEALAAVHALADDSGWGSGDATAQEAAAELVAALQACTR